MVLPIITREDPQEKKTQKWEYLRKLHEQVVSVPAQSSEWPAQASLKMRVETTMALDQHLHTKSSALV